MRVAVNRVVTGVWGAEVRRAFTLVEMLVVLAVIGLILAFAMPALTAMNAEARLTSTSQMIQGTLTRAYYLSLSETALTAVRFLPAPWDVSDKTGPGVAGRQRAVIYRYTGTSFDPNTPGNVAFNEYFARATELPPVDLPDGAWVAPLEALSNESVTLMPDPGSGGFGTPPAYSLFGPNFVLDGRIAVNGDPNAFAYDVNRRNRNPDGLSFLNADDFMLVFDPRAGLRSGTPQTCRLRAYSPADKYETDGDPKTSEPNKRYYQRYGFSGLIVYPREVFVTLGASATGQDRQAFLKTAGRPYMVQRFGGGLLSGAPGQ